LKITADIQKCKSVSCQRIMGYPIKVGTFGMKRYVIMAENYTQTDGSTAYKLTGLNCRDT